MWPSAMPKISYSIDSLEIIFIRTKNLNVVKIKMHYLCIITKSRRELS